MIRYYSYFLPPPFFVGGIFVYNEKNVSGFHVGDLVEYQYNFNKEDKYIYKIGNVESKKHLSINKSTITDSLESAKRMLILKILR